MSRRPYIPRELTLGPFTLAEAGAAGVTRFALRLPRFKRLGAATYLWTGLAETPARAIAAVHKRLPPMAVFSGLTAAWLHDLTEPLHLPIEVTVPFASGVSKRTRIRLRRAQLDPSEMVIRKGMPATSILRTIVDLSHQLPLVEAVALADVALHKSLLQPADLHEYLRTHKGCWGVAGVRRVAGLIEPATESPMETHLRVILVLAGLPCPQVQVALYDERGAFLGRADLYYPDQRLIIEYDGSTHRTSLVEDNRRQNRLVNAGYRILRFTAADVLNNQKSVIAQVREALGPGAATLRLPASIRRLSSNVA